jgi:DNA phosphorothioation-dependent restriction protein DptH
MSSGFQELRQEDVTRALEEFLLPRFQQLLSSRAPGHCMRVVDVDVDLMLRLVRTLRRNLPEAQVFILTDPSAAVETPELFVSSTKLVELRNPLPDGTLRPPLLVFLPSDLRTSAEDSFGVATFEEIVVADVYDELVHTLLQRLPLSLQGHVRDILALLTRERWAWADAVAQVRFLLTAIKNGVDGESLGAALYELGLVPDFRLFDDPSVTHGRIRKNLETVQKLTYADRSIRGRVLDLGLRDKSLRRRLTQFLVEMGVEEPYTWTRHIVAERANWELSFDNWRFAEEISPDKIALQVLHTDLPSVSEDETDERLQELIGQQVLVPRQRQKFKVVFQVDPHPGHIQGLHHFSVQIVAKDGDPVGVAKQVRVWKSKKTSSTVTLDRLQKVEFEEGWHVVRVLPWTADGDPIPLDLSDAEASSNGWRPYESEPFYVLPGAELEEEPPQRAIPQAASLEHARLQLQCTALLNRRDPHEISPEVVGWADKSSAARSTGQDFILIKFGRDGTYQVPVAKPLKRLEQSTLVSPHRPVSWRMDIHMGQASVPTGDILEWPQSAAVESFLAARARYFEAVRAGERELISQAADFLTLQEDCAEYVAAYRDLLRDLRQKIERGAGTDQQRAIIALRTALAVDTVSVTLTDFRGNVREAALVGPTHPLRALWLATWSHVAQHWLSAATDSPAEYVSPLRDGLLRRLVPLHVPATLSLPDGRVFTTVDTLHPFWSLYAPAAENDPRGLLGEICAGLHIPEPAIGGDAITGDVLASSLARYLVQHPYVRTLGLNVFNPGRATVLADALVTLQRQEAFADLHYDIRLFAPDPETPNIGEAIEQLCTPHGTVSTAAADAFSTSGGNHLFPKLNLAVHASRDFSVNPDHYRAHLCILFDLFPAEDLGTGVARQSNDVIPVHGLIQDFVVDFQDDENGTFWRRQLRQGDASPLPGAERLIDLLVDLPQIISGATATIATGTPAFEHRPILTFGLDAERRELIHHVHEVSDWVFTIDRNMGIEFYDHGGRRARPDYLIDYVPSAETGRGHQLLITSRSLTELEALLGPVLAQYGLSVERDNVSLLLEQLRSLSGRLALKLISSPTQQAEALGLALARLFLTYQEALTNQIILPLDVHLELFHAARKHAEELGDTVTLQRTDLALFDLNASSCTIRCNLVEVKCYAHVVSLGAFNQLKQAISQQILQSEDVLRQHFDPHWKTPDRPDRLLKTQELTALLTFYLDRAERYGLMGKEAVEEARYFLAALERPDNP